MEGKVVCEWLIKSYKDETVRKVWKGYLHSITKYGTIFTIVSFVKMCCTENDFEFYKLIATVCGIAVVTGNDASIVTWGQGSFAEKWNNLIITTLVLIAGTIGLFL